jgi:MFS family permease
MPAPTYHPRLIRRLTPLYAATFLQGLVLWYSLEKIFMTSIGFTAATISIMAAAYSAMMLLIDTPAGMLADRWSRKGMLIIGSFALALSSLVCGLSQSVPMFILGAAIWGIFFGFYNGMYDSIVYDTLSEETGHSDDYEKYYGRIRVMDSLALIIGSLAGGFIGSQFGLRVSFYLTIPIALLSILPLILFKEPLLHKQSPHDSLLAHISATLTAVLRRRSLVQILAVLILGSFVVDMLFEFCQLWLIGNNAPLYLYGPANALILSSIGLAGLIAYRLQVAKPAIRISFIIITVSAATLLIVARNSYAAIVVIFTLCLAFKALDILFLRLLHDRLPSNIRSGSSSTITTISRLMFIIGALAFGWIAHHFAVFTAGWIILIPVILVSLVLMLAPVLSPAPAPTERT